MIPEPRQILTTGITVLTADGRRGRLREVLISPGHRRLEALVIRYGVLSPRDVVVPLDQIANITDVQVRLRISRAELGQLPAYRPLAHAELALSGSRHALVALQYSSASTSEQIIEVPSSTALAIAGSRARPADGLIALRVGQHVWSDMRRVGRLEYLLLDSSGRVRQVVVRTSRVFGRGVLVPIDHVARSDAQGVWLALERVAFERLPDYRTDRALLIDVDQALRNDEIVRRLDYPSIDVTVRAGVVGLRGHATTPVSRIRAERAARGVRGVLGVVNEIVVDGEIQLTVAEALGQDERTRGYRLYIHVQRGVVYISGQVDSPEVRTAVETLAGSVPQVRAVINQISTPGDASTAEDLRALFPRISQEVYTNEARLGLVERLILHPLHRRVTALVVRGWLAQAHQTTMRVSLEPQPRQERRLVIPTSAIQELTEAAVLLHIDDGAALRHAEFDPSVYATPAAEWQPPYPYTHAEVLLEPDHTPVMHGDGLGLLAKLEILAEQTLGKRAKEVKHEWQTAVYTAQEYRPLVI